MKETKEQLIEKILTYMNEKGEIVDKLMVKHTVENDTDPIESFYTKKDEEALKKLLVKRSKTEIRACIERIVHPEPFGRDRDICPFCFFFIESDCKECLYGENHGICVGKKTSTYKKITMILTLGIYGIEGIQDLINSTF